MAWYRGEMRVGVAILALAAGCGFQHGALTDGRVSDGLPDDTTGSGSDASIPGANPDATPDSAASILPCPVTYTLSNGSSKYRSVTASTTWTAAETDCEDDATPNVTRPAHTIVLDNDAERAYAFMQNNSDQWVGITDRNTEQAYLAVTNQMPFFLGSATGNNTSKDCLILNSTDTTSEACSNGHPYLCECDGLAANPANF